MIVRALNSKAPTHINTCPTKTALSNRHFETARVLFDNRRVRQLQLRVSDFRAERINISIIYRNIHKLTIIALSLGAVATFFYMNRYPSSLVSRLLAPNQI